MSIKEQLTNDFQSLITKTDKESFTQAKLKFYKTLFSNSVEEDSLDVFVGAFELSCEAYLITDFLPIHKETLKRDFQGILIALGAFQPAK